MDLISVLPSLAGFRKVGEYDLYCDGSLKGRHVLVCLPVVAKLVQKAFVLNQPS
jgi:hypothetical protein